MSFTIDNKLKTSFIIYAIIIAIILIQKPTILFNSNMELKILVLSKDRKYSVPLLYIIIILAAIISYCIPRS
jgi:hypothetical protein